MNGEQILDELLKKVMVVVEANEYVLASGVRSRTNKNYENYEYNKNNDNNCAEFVLYSGFDRIIIEKNNITGNCDVKYEEEDSTNGMAQWQPDIGFVSFCVGDRYYSKKDIIESDERFEKITEMLKPLLNAFKYKYADIVSGMAFNSKMLQSKVANHIELYMKKIADIIQNNGQLTGHFGPLDQDDNITIKLQKRTGSSGYPALVLTFETSKMAIVHSDKNSIFKFMYPESIINYETKTEGNSPVLNDLRKMRLQDMLCEFTSGLGENATFEDVVNTIFWRSRHPFVNDELAREINSLLGGRGLVYPETQIQNAPGYEKGKTM